MHIVDITMFWAPASGGVRTYLEAKAAWLRQQPDIQHTLLVPGASARHDGDTRTLPAPSLPFANGYRFPLRKQAWIDQLIEMRPDIIEANDPYVPAWAALEAGRRLGVPVIGFYHSDLPRLVGSRAGHWTNRLMNRYVHNLYRRFDRVLAPSQVMADNLHALDVRKAHVQPLGVDARCFHPDKRTGRLRARLGLGDDTRLLVFGGRGAREKNLPVLLESMRLLGARYHLHLVGSHMPRQLPTNVTTSDRFASQDELAGMLADSDALVHAGDRETFGLIVLEAMASGLPVVGVDAGAIAELIVPGTGLLAEPLSATSMAETVQHLFRRDWQEMGQQARRHVENTYSWDNVFRLLLAHYRELGGATEL